MLIPILAALSYSCYGRRVAFWEGRSIELALQVNVILIIAVERECICALEGVAGANRG
jgi:hypothetical protein